MYQNKAMAKFGQILKKDIEKKPIRRGERDSGRSTGAWKKSENFVQMTGNKETVKGAKTGKFIIIGPRSPADRTRFNRAITAIRALHAQPA
jgi:hypothetical protein